MTTPGAKLLVAAGKEAACVKICGRANFNSSIDFKRLITGLLERGCLVFVLDLSECALMDSTFLGVLAGFGLKLQQEGGSPRIELVNPNTRVAELLENLGVLHLFKISDGQIPLEEALHAEEIPAAKVTRQELTRASLEAHQTLMSFNPENAARFKDVARFLSEDLSRQDPA